jgi:hypothetical protein
MRWAFSAFVLGALSCGGHALRGPSAGGADANADVASSGADAGGGTDASARADASPGPADGVYAGSSADAANEAVRDLPAGGADASAAADASPGPADGANAGSIADAANEAALPVSLCADPTDGGLGQAQTDGGLVVARIVESPSTNTEGSEFDMYCDGSAVGYTLPRRFGTAPVPPPPYYDPPNTPGVVQCLAALQALGDVSTIAVDHSSCPKSASFGTTTTIWFAGKSTPDLQCPHLSPTAAQSAVLTDCL